MIIYYICKEQHAFKISNIIINTSFFFIFLGNVQNDPKLYTNFSGFPRNWEALDNNLRTFYQSNQQKDMSLWFVRLNSTLKNEMDSGLN